jgi:hypothetical protein
MVNTMIKYSRSLVNADRRSSLGISSTRISLPASRFVAESSFSSSRDSEHVSVAESNKLYDNAAAQHPDTILALNHETYSTYPPCYSLDNDDINLTPL